ncbi:6-phosphofructo-2-kinase [Musa troglodytarum]|uniref:6-phosphofructo-2-kinase n=1 Tax=Musa troglodytarum TaxID=320322 RepID=A0A9E7GAC5_9LILI|nr:6-phosphofructo-2-kinase [Musa troglodytarum]
MLIAGSISRTRSRFKRTLTLLKRSGDEDEHDNVVEDRRVGVDRAIRLGRLTRATADNFLASRSPRKSETS